MCTAASPASISAPSAYAAGTAVWRAALVGDSRAAMLVDTVAPRARCLLGDLVAGGGHDVPGGAERVQALAVCVAGLLVAREQVERVAVVGHLRLAVGAGRRA